MKLWPLRVVLLKVFLMQACSQAPPQQEITLRVGATDLIPEGISYSQATECFYLSSIHKSKIIRVDDRYGAHHDFIASGEYGFPPGIGLWADDDRGHLWAIGSHVERTKRGSRVYQFDLHSGDLVSSFAPDDTLAHFLNDLVVTESGEAYVTDSDNHAVYCVDPNGSCTLWLQSDEIQYPNGIAYSPRKRLLYVASFTMGIRVIDLESGQLLNLPDTTDLTRGIDGLRYYARSLVGVQNGFQSPEKHRLVLYHLNQDETAIVGHRILAVNHETFDTPTTLVIKEDYAFCVANSQLSKLDQATNTLIPGAEMDTTIVLGLPLVQRSRAGK